VNKPQYCARRDEDGGWSIVDTETRTVAVIAETLPLERLDEAAAMEIVDVLRKGICFGRTPRHLR
jgi:hypothetical protein